MGRTGNSERMKKLNRSFQRSRWMQILVLCSILGCALFVWTEAAKSDDAPGLSIQLLSSNQLQLTVTNGVVTNSYEIYRRPIWDSVYPWTLHLLGTNGQTNFLTAMGVESIGFFQARSGNDTDGDGVPNSQDGDPRDPALGILTITIDSPANGANFQ